MSPPNGRGYSNCLGRAPLPSRIPAFALEQGLIWLGVVPIQREIGVIFTHRWCDSWNSSRCGRTFLSRHTGEDHESAETFWLLLFLVTTQCCAVLPSCRGRCWWKVPQWAMASRLAQLRIVCSSWGHLEKRCCESAGTNIACSVTQVGNFR